MRALTRAETANQTLLTGKTSFRHQPSITLILSSLRRLRLLHPPILLSIAFNLNPARPPPSQFDPLSSALDPPPAIQFSDSPTATHLDRISTTSILLMHARRYIRSAESVQQLTNSEHTALCVLLPIYVGRAVCERERESY